jgi:hypothetical protein
VSAHGRNNFAFRKERSDLDLPLEDGATFRERRGDGSALRVRAQHEPIESMSVDPWAP